LILPRPVIAWTGKTARRRAELDELAFSGPDSGWRVNGVKRRALSLMAAVEQNASRGGQPTRHDALIVDGDSFFLGNRPD